MYSTVRISVSQQYCFRTFCLPTGPHTLLSVDGHGCREAVGVGAGAEAGAGAGMGYNYPYPLVTTNGWAAKPMLVVFGGLVFQT